MNQSLRNVRHRLAAVVAIIALMTATAAHASGSSMPWEAPLQSILESIEGPVAKIVLPTIRHFQDVYPQVTGEYCFRCSFNLSFQNGADAAAGWTSPYHFGISLGPVVLMCENYRSELLWRLMRASPYVVTGLRRAGFKGGWL